MGILKKETKRQDNHERGNYWILLKIIVSITTYLVTSNGELLIVYNIVRNVSLQSNVVSGKK